MKKIYERFSLIQKRWWELQAFMSYLNEKYIFATFSGKEEHWIWTYSDKNLTDSFWGTNYPNTNIGNTDDCALMVLRSSTFWWQDSSCLTTTVQSKTVAPICQHERIETATSPTLPPSTTTEICPPGWVEFEAHCYFYSGNDVTMIWPNAENDCIHRGGHLASIHSQEEHEFVYNISISFTWLGATDRIAQVCYLHYNICLYIDT